METTSGNHSMANAIDDRDPDDPWNYHRCKCCGYKTRFLSSILNHVRLHRRRSNKDRFLCYTHPPQPYHCEKCDFKSHFKAYFTMHFKFFHKEQETQHKTVMSRPVLKCQNCDFRTHSSLILLNHNCRDITDHNSPQTPQNWKIEPKEENEEENKPLSQQESLKESKPLECDHCPYGTTTKRSLKMDVLLNHNCRDITDHNSLQTPQNWKIEPKEENEEENKPSSQQETLIKESKPLEYDHCPYGTTTKQSLKMHVLLNHNCRDITDHNSPQTSQNWKIEPKEENEPSSQQETLKKSKPLECDHCPYGTTTKQSLKMHVLLKHTPPEQIKWHKCEHCPYKAKVKSYLLEHVLTRHTNPVELEKLKRFKCDHCSYKARKKVLLKNHILCKHTPSNLINWIKCEYCPYKAKVNIMLYQHMRTRHKKSERSREA